MTAHLINIHVKLNKRKQIQSNTKDKFELLTIGKREVEKTNLQQRITSKMQKTQPLKL